MDQLKYSHWIVRTFAFAVFCLCEVAAAVWFVPAILLLFNNIFPNALFHQLAPGEEPGPLSTVDQFLWVFGMIFLLIPAVIIPFGIYLRMRWPIIALAAILNIPAVVWVFRNYRLIYNH